MGEFDFCLMEEISFLLLEKINPFEVYASLAFSPEIGFETTLKFVFECVLNGNFLMSLYKCVLF